MLDLLSIKSELENLVYINQVKFMKLIAKNKIPYSENKNGTFINITELSNEQIKVIEEFIFLIKEEEFTFNLVEKTKNNLKNLIDNKDIEKSYCDNKKDEYNCYDSLNI